MLKVKKILLSLLISSSILLSVQAKELKFGKEIELKEKTNVSEVLKTPESFVGKNILIKGKVLDVCSKRGCWMKLSSDQKKESILIKVKDGEIIFPVDAKGKDAEVEGELFKVTVSKEEQEEMEKEGTKGSNHKEHKEYKKTKDKKGSKVIYMFKPKAVKIN